MSPTLRWLQVTLLLLAAPVGTQPPESEKYQQQLYNACRPMLLAVGFHSYQIP